MKKFYKDQDLKLIESVFKNLEIELKENNNKSVYIDNFSIYFFDYYNNTEYSIKSFNLSNPDKKTYFNLNIQDQKKPTESFKQYHKRINKKLSFNDVLGYIKNTNCIDSVTIIKKPIQDLNLDPDVKICLFFNDIRVNIENTIELIYDLNKKQILTQDHEKIINLFKELQNNNYISVTYNNQKKYLCDYFLLY